MSEWKLFEPRQDRRLRKLYKELGVLEKDWGSMRQALIDYQRDRYKKNHSDWYNAALLDFELIDIRRNNLLNEILTIETPQARVVSKKR